MKIINLLSRYSPAPFKSKMQELLPASVYQLLSNNTEKYYLMSFPKSGRTWLRVLLGKFLITQYKLEEHLNPIEFSAFWKINKRIPRITVTHGGKVAWQAPEEIHLPKELTGKKIILLIRDPRDIIVSLYYQLLNRNKSFKGTLKEFLYQNKGSIDSIIQYYNQYILYRHKFKDMLIVKYEDLRARPEEEMIKIFDFLKIKITSTENLLSAINYASFENMKAREANNDKASSGFDPLKAVDLDNPNSFKTRKGLIKGYKNEFELPEILYLQKKLSALNPIFGYNSTD